MTSIKKEKCTAIIVAAGQGKRMGTQTQKQFLDLGEGKPVLYYSLACFQESPVIDEIILVTSRDGLDLCKNEIVDRYDLRKVTKIIPGGRQRRDSVYEGLKQCEGTDYVFIHDGARPFITGEILQRAMDAVREHKACAVGVPAKDTVKLLDREGFVRETPKREQTWLVQTPQCFAYPLICSAHGCVKDKDAAVITDDAVAVELSGLAKVKMVMGAYTNLKITTPEDIAIAKVILRG
jgi:2-C-methyl-D-erythritol 4-phosphate cytidylyltransferase